MIVRALITLALVLCAPFAARGGDYDGSKTLLCVKVDFANKALSGRLESGDERKTPVRHVERGDDSTLLQGGEFGRGWSLVIQHATGEMSGAIAGEEGAVVLLGACTVH
jgi:hypothetical protein